jgi:hypothetical protein
MNSGQTRHVGASSRRPETAQNASLKQRKAVYSLANSSKISGHNHDRRKAQSALGSPDGAQGGKLYAEGAWLKQGSSNAMLIGEGDPHYD